MLVWVPDFHFLKCLVGNAALAILAGVVFTAMVNIRVLFFTSVLFFSAKKKVFDDEQWNSLDYVLDAFSSFLKTENSFPAYIAIMSLEDLPFKAAIIERRFRTSGR